MQVVLLVLIGQHLFLYMYKAKVCHPTILFISHVDWMYFCSIHRHIMAPELLYHLTSVRLLHRANPLTLICGDHHRYSFWYARNTVSINIRGNVWTLTWIFFITASDASLWCAVRSFICAWWGLCTSRSPSCEFLYWCLLLHDFQLFFSLCHIRMEVLRLPRCNLIRVSKVLIGTLVAHISILHYDPPWTNLAEERHGTVRSIYGVPFCCSLCLY